jgi:hypothetical protein
MQAFGFTHRQRRTGPPGCRLTIAADYAPAEAVLHDFLTCGRKFILPLIKVFC